MELLLLLSSFSLCNLSSRAAFLTCFLCIFLVFFESASSNPESSSGFELSEDPSSSSELDSCEDSSAEESSSISEPEETRASESEFCVNFFEVYVSTLYRIGSVHTHEQWFAFS